MRSNQASSSNSTKKPFSLSVFLYPHFYECAGTDGSAVFISFTVISFFLIIPLCGFILYVGVQRWRKQRQTSSVMAMSHADLLTYNIIALEPISLVMSAIYCSGIKTNSQNLMKGGVYALFLIYVGRLLFQCLTCVEQYLAVIHPVVYLKMKTERGIKICNITIGCIWLLCFVLLSLSASAPVLPITPFFAGFAVGLLVVSFCSMSVLHALIRPRPGDMVGDSKKVNRAKKRAFINITSITLIIFLKYAGLVVCIALHAFSLFSFNDRCIILMSAFWFCLPNSLSMPLQFLYRTRNFPCAVPKSESG